MRETVLVYRRFGEGERLAYGALGSDRPELLGPLCSIARQAPSYLSDTGSHGYQDPRRLLSIMLPPAGFSSEFLGPLLRKRVAPNAGPRRGERLAPDGQRDISTIISRLGCRGFSATRMRMRAPALGEGVPSNESLLRLVRLLLALAHFIEKLIPICGVRLVHLRDAARDLLLS